jgi:2-dehydro-3-deoxy-D-arabinonate dehydratase
LRLCRTAAGWWVETEPGRGVAVPAGETLTCRDDLFEHLTRVVRAGQTVPLPGPLLAPVEHQEVWASGVTYFRSRSARMAESESSGGGDFYDRVYHAERPELFFKAPPYRVVGPGDTLRIRRDSQWNVPEPELTLLISPSARILGYTIGNDMSSRDIEGANPLYLPQAKSYDRACAIGPAILVSPDPLPTSTGIHLHIYRGRELMFSGTTNLAEMKRRPEELVAYLFRETSFPGGCFLLTGTGIVPPDSFTLAPQDEIKITIDGIGTLINTVEKRK